MLSLNKLGARQPCQLRWQLTSEPFMAAFPFPVCVLLLQLSAGGHTGLHSVVADVIFSDERTQHLAMLWSWPSSSMPSGPLKWMHNGTLSSFEPDAEMHPGAAVHGTQRSGRTACPNKLLEGIRQRLPVKGSTSALATSASGCLRLACLCHWLPVLGNEPRDSSSSHSAQIVCTSVEEKGHHDFMILLSR